MQTYRKYSSKYFCAVLTKSKNMDVPKNILDLLIIIHNIFIHSHIFFCRHKIKYKYPCYLLYSFMSILLIIDIKVIKEILILNTGFKNGIHEFFFFLLRKIWIFFVFYSCQHIFNNKNVLPTQ